MKNSLLVIIPHYNNLKGLNRTLNSIREKVLLDVLIVDDGSMHPAINKKIMYNGNYKIILLKKNSGIGVALNEGLEYAMSNDYEFIGRLDCGDLCHKNKFTKQLNYLINNKDIMLLGTWVRIIDQQGNFKYNLKHPTDYNSIKKNMYYNSMFVHPTVVFRTKIVEVIGKYPYKYRRAAQDYSFFFKIINQFKAENFPEILLDYEQSKSSISTLNRRAQVYNRIRIIIDNFYFGITPIYAIVRSLILMITPLKVISLLKIKLYK